MAGAYSQLAVDVSARLALALRHRDRRPWRADRARERHAARRLLPDADFRTARHARYGVLGARRATRAFGNGVWRRGGHAAARGRRSSVGEPLGESRPLSERRRRPCLDSAGLSAVRATVAGAWTRRLDTSAVASLGRFDALEFSDPRPAARAGVRSCAVGRPGLWPWFVHRRRSGAAVAARLSLDGLVRLAGCVWHELVRRSGGGPDRSDADSAPCCRTLPNVG